MISRLFLWLVFLLFLGNNFCSGQDTLNGGEVGSACYYNPKLHGRKTSSGEPYHRKKYTCAHKWLPLGTIVKVTNARTGQSVEVKVNDRGPFCKKYQIDLSEIAAKEISIKGDGNNKVTIVPIAYPISLKSKNGEPEADSLFEPTYQFEPGFSYSPNGAIAALEGFGLHLSTQTELSKAKELANYIGNKKIKPSVFILPEIGSDGTKIYQVYVGNYDTKLQAKKALQGLVKENLRGNKPIVKKYSA